MSSKPKANSTSAHPDRKRGRGGLGKYLRARGRRGAGRPAQFHERLLLEGEKPEDEDEDEEAAAALRVKYGPRQLSSNADRYAESEPELDSDGAFQDIKLTSQRSIYSTDLQGELIQEPEVDLSKFLERQRLSDEQGHSYPYERAVQAGDEDDIDHSLAHITSNSTRKRLQTSQTKGKMQELVWDEELESLAREKAAAEAKWGSPPHSISTSHI